MKMALRSRVSWELAGLSSPRSLAVGPSLAQLKRNVLERRVGDPPMREEMTRLEHHWWKGPESRNDIVINALGI